MISPVLVSLPRVADLEGVPGSWLQSDLTPTHTLSPQPSLLHSIPLSLWLYLSNKQMILKRNRNDLSVDGTQYPKRRVRNVYPKGRRNLICLVLATQTSTSVQGNDNTL